MATLEEIALEAKCGTSTVARVLSHSNQELRPSAQRRAKEIRAIAARLGYRPSLAAKSHRTGRYHCIAVLCAGNSEGYLPSGLLLGAEGELARHNQHLIFTHMTDEQLIDETHLPKTLRECASDGFLIHCTGHFPSHVRQILERHDIPTVWANEQLEADCAYPDDRRGARELTEYLAGLGHRRITYAGPAAGGHYSNGERLEGYHEAIAAAGLEARVFHAQEHTLPVGISISEADRFLTANMACSEPSTALIINETCRAAPLYAAALRLGLKVPEELSFAVCTENFGNPLLIPFTMSLVPVQETAAAAVRMLLAKIDTPLERQKPQAIAPLLFMGETSCSPLNEEWRK